MPADSSYRCGWWYRDEFAAPVAPQKQARFWLRSGGINYRAEIWLNGHKIADASEIAGAYRPYHFDVTDELRLGERDVLAVEAFAPTEKDLDINLGRLEPPPARQRYGPLGRG